MDCYLTFQGFVLTLIIQLLARKLCRQLRNYTYGYVLTCMTVFCLQILLLRTNLSELINFYSPEITRKPNVNLFKFCLNSLNIEMKFGDDPLSKNVSAQ